MVGAGMIFDETYRPAFEKLRRQPIYVRETGLVDVALTALASRTGHRAVRIQKEADGALGPFQILTGEEGFESLLHSDVSAICIATPDDRHFELARRVLEAGKHVLIEKPSVLSLAELDALDAIARSHQRLAKVVYHKLLDPDHKKLRTLVVDGVLDQVTSGYCSLLEPKSIALGQFTEWIAGRNPGTYVAVHYIKLVDFTFGGRLKRISASGQRGTVGTPVGSTWDSVQLRLEYEYDSGRDATFDIHTSWVHPDNFPGYVEQEVQFRFVNGVWNGHSRKRGVELTVENRTPTELKSTINNHYNARFLEPWGDRTQRGYGVEVIERFFEEVAFVEWGGDLDDRPNRWQSIRKLKYNDLSSDRPSVAAVQGMEAILQSAARGDAGSVVTVDSPQGGLVQWSIGQQNPVVLYGPKIYGERAPEQEPI
ncbi:Gfo/Idh/MocA family oxidoreductase [bacterium]|nr:Gfo/Idh/MocA family oxidoreductase [bacterium]